MAGVESSFVSYDLTTRDGILTYPAVYRDIARFSKGFVGPLKPLLVVKTNPQVASNYHFGATSASCATPRPKEKFSFGTGTSATKTSSGDMPTSRSKIR